MECSCASTNKQTLKTCHGKCSPSCVYWTQSSSAREKGLARFVNNTRVHLDHSQTVRFAWVIVFHYDSRTCKDVQYLDALVNKKCVCAVHTQLFRTMQPDRMPSLTKLNFTVYQKYLCGAWAEFSMAICCASTKCNELATKFANENQSSDHQLFNTHHTKWILNSYSVNRNYFARMHLS